MGATNLGKETGVQVNLVSRMMHVDRSIVTYSKLREKHGFLRHESFVRMCGSC